jgi:predicted ATP-dependent protease
MQELKAEQLRAGLPLGAFPQSSDEVAALPAVWGQQRAREAIAFGLGLAGDGHNIVVAGSRSSGRTMMVRALVNEAALARSPAADWCYLHNFRDPDRPRAVTLPLGLGYRLQHDLAGLVRACREEIPNAFESDSYEQRRAEALRPIREAREQAVVDLRQAAAGDGFSVTLSAAGLVAQPVTADGTPLSQEALVALSEQERLDLQRRTTAVEAAIASALRRLRALDAEAVVALADLDKDVVRFVVGHILQTLREQYGRHGLNPHFAAIEDDLLHNVERFKAGSSTAGGRADRQDGAVETGLEDTLKRYSVNLFTTHEAEPASESAPVVEEPHPTHRNLFGYINYQYRLGSLSTDFTQVKPGSVHMANAGYLILQLEDLLADAQVWVTLKRCLKAREVRVGGVDDAPPSPAMTLSPAPIPLSVKVVLIGRPRTVALLEAADPEFPELFKIRADFEPDLACDEAGLTAYFGLVRRTVERCRLRPFRRDALAEVIHFGTRLAARQDRLTAQFGLIVDLCQEASHVADLAGAPAVQGTHVAAAIEGKRRRSSLIPERLRELMAEGALRIETTGAVAGQVNGLAVYQTGAQSFGTPLRITCRTGIGRKGIVDIEREVERSGAIHSKGVLVLSGYLVGTFGSAAPLSFTASLTFEQSYDEVEGDSASSAELYAILAALGRVLLRQDVAVTGSVDQFGHVQAVGGVTEKIEGFYDLCSLRGLSGSQGVIIPTTNVLNLVLRPDVIEAVAAGRFHLWAVSSIEEGLEILSGVPAGNLQPDGSYPAGTVFRAVSDAVAAMRRAVAGEPVHGAHATPDCNDE